MFYDVYCLLCKEKGVSPSKAATEIGLNKSLVSHWKSGSNSLKDDSLKRMASYFEVPISALLEEAPFDMLTLISEHKEEFIEELPISDESLAIWNIRKDRSDAASIINIINMMHSCIKWCDITEDGWSIMLNDTYVKLIKQSKLEMEKAAVKTPAMRGPVLSRTDKELMDLIKKLSPGEKAVVKRCVNELLLKRAKNMIRMRRGAVAVSKKY